MRFIKDINIKKILSLFRQQEGSPFFNAKGVALGVFSGCFPFFGFQTLLGLFLAKLARGNILLAAVGTWISNPFTYIPLYYFNYKVGSILLNNHSSFIMEKNIEINDLWRQGRMFSLKLIIGSSLVGLLLASISGLIVFFMYKFRTKK